MLRLLTCLLAASFLLYIPAIAAPLAIPTDLDQWRAWVLQDEDYRQCPHLSTEPTPTRHSFWCAWPERLSLTLDPHSGTFAQHWQLFTKTWVRLPGSLDYWPQDVRVDGAPGVVVTHDNAPQLLLPPGSHTISGRLSFATRPELLQIDTRTAMLDLTLDGKHVAQPERPDGGIWLGKQRSAEQPQRMDVQVYRLVRDEIPVQLITTVRLSISGDGREELLARVLPDGFTAESLTSELPSRLEPDGRLRVQVRAGSWDITLAAHGADVASHLSRPPVQGPWAREEIWSFAGQDRLRVVSAQGADGIDPKQAGVPSGWERYPAFRMAPDSVLTVVERTRGLENTDDNRLTLNRRVWLDFERGGLTAIDTIAGNMRRQWRLEMTGPYKLERALDNGEPLLVTRNADNSDAGLEVRTPNLILVTTSRIPNARSLLPATGWKTRFERVTGELNLPPGHRLLAAMGTDSAPGSWIEGWGLWTVFGVLVVAVFAGWIAGWPVGALALGGLLLMDQDAPQYIWLWANAIAAVALVRAAPEGRLRRLAGGYRALSFFVLGLVVLPFLWGQVRFALYPQLETTSWSRRGQAFDASVAQSRFALNTLAAAAPEPAPTYAPALQESAGLAERLPPPPPKLERPPEMQISQRYAAGTLLQTGPGIPNWAYQTYSFSWSGPVEVDQTVRFLYLGPLLLGLWRLTGVVLLVLLFLALLRPSSGARGMLKGWGRGPRATTGAGVVCFLIALTIAPEVHAASTPDPRILEELKTRLTQPPDCLPSCSDITSASVSAHNDRLEILLTVSALAPTAVPMPGAGDRWQLDSVTLDDHAALTVARGDDGVTWVPIAPGAHTVRLSGRLAAAKSIDLAFPVPPHHITLSNDGWDVSGLNDEQRLVSGSLELVRRRGSSGTDEALEMPSEFSSFVRVSRRFDLGLEWTVTTTVERIAPEHAALSVEVPLLSAESVLSQNLQTHATPDGRRTVLIGLERGQAQMEWSSVLNRTTTLDLESTANPTRTEVWSFVVGPQWNVAFEGTPAVLQEDSTEPTWVHEFHPRPGEKLRLHITRPEAAAGATLAIDSVDQHVSLGKRSQDVLLLFDYRSTQGGRHTIHLPETARVTRVELDNQPTQLRPDHGELSLGLLPGTHSVLIEWTGPHGATGRSLPPEVDLHTAASNVRTIIDLPADRWPLFVTGPGVGPAVLYWGELVLFLAIAWPLGRWPRSPLRTHEWLLLGLGLSSLSWAVLAFVALWLFAMRWRESWTADVSQWRFNFIQVLLAVLTLCAVSALVFIGIRASLLASPHMVVTGPGSRDNTFSWFLDQSASELPRPMIISAPLWVYRTLMFAWALWMVLALLRWLRWAWRAWKTNGTWRGESTNVPQPPVRA
jgi:hypothetical protein